MDDTIYVHCRYCKSEETSRGTLALGQSRVPYCQVRFIFSINFWYSASMQLKKANLQILQKNSAAHHTQKLKTVPAITE